MKASVIATLMIVATGTAVAQPFDFQRQFGSTEYVYDADTAHLNFAPVTASAATPSLDAVMLSSNVDGIAPNRFVGQIEQSGPSRISLYEVQRGSPEATANRGYYDRFPADTDWAMVAREHRHHGMEEGLAAESATKGNAS